MPCVTTMTNDGTASTCAGAGAGQGGKQGRAVLLQRQAGQGRWSGKGSGRKGARQAAPPLGTWPMSASMREGEGCASRSGSCLRGSGRGAGAAAPRALAGAAWTPRQQPMAGQAPPGPTCAGPRSHHKGSPPGTPPVLGVLQAEARVDRVPQVQRPNHQAQHAHCEPSLAVGGCAGSGRSPRGSRRQAGQAGSSGAAPATKAARQPSRPSGRVWPMLVANSEPGAGGAGQRCGRQAAPASARPAF